MFIFFSQVLAQMRSTGDVNPGHYSKTIAQVVTLIFLSRSKKSVFQLIKNPPFEGAWPDSLLPRALHGPPRYPCHCHTGSTGRTDEHGGVCNEKCSLQGRNPHDHVSTSQDIFTNCSSPGRHPGRVGWNEHSVKLQLKVFLNEKRTHRSQFLCMNNVTMFMSNISQWPTSICFARKGRIGSCERM